MTLGQGLSEGGGMLPSHALLFVFFYSTFVWNLTITRPRPDFTDLAFHTVYTKSVQGISFLSYVSNMFVKSLIQVHGLSNGLNWAMLWSDLCCGNQTGLSHQRRDMPSAWKLFICRLSNLYNIEAVLNITNNISLLWLFTPRILSS